MTHPRVASARFLGLVSFLSLTTGWMLVGPGCSKKVPEKAAGPEVSASAQQAVRPNKAPSKCEPGPDGRCEISATCSAKCQRVSTQDCVQCEQAGPCAPFTDACNRPGMTPEEQALCFDIQSCIQTSNCFDGPAKVGIGRCYCGTLDTKQCIAAPFEGPGAPNGPCRDLIVKGMPGATKNTHVLGNLTTRTHTAGWAMSRLNCQKVGNGEKCAKLCGFGADSPAFPE